jgi:3-hydroxyisobutyrate dehydrogenase-like beta-hydroxyacid dehydrogenase
MGVNAGLNMEALKSVLPGGGAGSFALDSLLTRLLPNLSFAPHAAKMIEKDTTLYQAMCAKMGLDKTMIDTNAERALEIVSKELQTLV